MTHHIWARNWLLSSMIVAKNLILFMVHFSLENAIKERKVVFQTEKKPMI